LAFMTALVVPAARRRASNAICLVGISMCYLTTTEGAAHRRRRNRR
jgi:hypothetical protein